MRFFVFCLCYAYIYFVLFLCRPFSNWFKCLLLIFFAKVFICSISTTLPVLSPSPQLVDQSQNITRAMEKICMVVIAPWIVEGKCFLSNINCLMTQFFGRTQAQHARAHVDYLLSHFLFIHL